MVVVEDDWGRNWTSSVLSMWIEEMMNVHKSRTLYMDQFTVTRVQLDPAACHRKVEVMF